MKKIIFGSICMIVSVIGVITMILVSLSGNKVYGAINGSTDMFTYLNWYGMTSTFIIFCLLGILGLALGLWGTFDKDNLK